MGVPLSAHQSQNYGRPASGAPFFHARRHGDVGLATSQHRCGASFALRASPRGMAVGSLAGCFYQRPARLTPVNGLERCLAIGALGALGALFRYALSEAVLRVVSGPAWVSTLVVNVLGCYLLGVVDRLALAGMLSPALRVVIVVGFLGAFTTFSTYARELVALGAQRDFVGLLLQVLAQNLLGCLAVLAGMASVAVFKP
jgi:CrcB protein